MSKNSNRKLPRPESDMPLEPNIATPKEVLDKGQKISSDWIQNAIKKDLSRIIDKKRQTEDGDT